MTQTDIYAKLTSVFEDVLDIEDVQLTETTTADDIEEWDSLSHLQIIVKVEKSLGIKFKASEIGGFENVGQLVAAIEEKLAAK